MAVVRRTSHLLDSHEVVSEEKDQWSSAMCAPDIRGASDCSGSLIVTVEDTARLVRASAGRQGTVGGECHRAPRL